MPSSSSVSDAHEVSMLVEPRSAPLFAYQPGLILPLLRWSSVRPGDANAWGEPDVDDWPDTRLVVVAVDVLLAVVFSRWRPLPPLKMSSVVP